MAIATDPRPEGSGTQTYVLTSDRELPPEQQTVWTFRPLRDGEWARIMDLVLVSSQGVAGAGVASVAQEVLSSSLVGVQNFWASKVGGETIDVTRDRQGRVSETFLERIRWPDKLELANFAQSLTRLTEAEVEKPAPSPTE